MATHHLFDDRAKKQREVKAKMKMPTLEEARRLAQSIKREKIEKKTRQETTEQLKD